MSNPTIKYSNFSRISLLAAAALVIAGCSSPEDQAALYLDEAHTLFEEGDLITARLELRNALQIQPKNPRARYLMALIDERDEKYKHVIANLLVAVESDPMYVDARVKLGYYYAIGHQIEDAKEQADAVMALDPDNPEVRLLNARALYLGGNSKAALEQANIALSLDPTRRDVVNFAAALHTSAGDTDQALAVIEQGINDAQAEDIEPLRRARISILQQIGEPGQIEDELNRMVEDYPDSPTYRLALLQLFVAQDRMAEAEKMIATLVAKDPDNAAWRISLARLLLSQDKSADAESSLQQAVRDNPESSPMRFALAGFYEANGRIDDAIDIYRQIAETGPQSPEGLAARNRIAVLNIDVDNDKALRLINEILTDDPNNVDALLSRAAIRFINGQLNEVIADLRLALVRKSDSERALLLLARAYLSNDDVVLAEDTYRRLLNVNPANRPARNELASLVGNRGNTDETEELLRKSLEIGPGDSGASRNLIRALLINENFEDAANEARRIIGLGENTGVADYQLGLALQAQEDFAGAIAAYKESVHKNPTADESLDALIRLLAQTGRLDEAETYLETHIDNHPEHIKARLILADLLRGSGRLERAQPIYYRIILEQPATAGAYIGLAATHPGASDERITVLADGHKKNPGNPLLGLALGVTYEKHQAYEDAIAVYEQIIAVNGGNNFIVNNLVALLLDFRTDQASFEQALRLASRFEDTTNHPFNLAVLGWAHYRNEQYPQAVRHLERAVAMSQNRIPQLRYYLGMAYLKNSNLVAAQQELQNAVDAALAADTSFTGLEDAQLALKSLAADET